MGMLLVSLTREYAFPRFRRCRWASLLSPWLLCLLVSGASVASGLPDTVDRVRPSIVAVGTYQPSGSPRQQFRGTGFAVGNGHMVVTNHHVVENAVAIRCVLSDRRELQATLVGQDEEKVRSLTQWSLLVQFRGIGGRIEPWLPPATSQRSWPCPLSTPPSFSSESTA